MNRRSFLSKAAVSTNGALSYATRIQTQLMNNKITNANKGYLKILFQLAEGQNGQPCSLFESGQEFIAKHFWEPPTGFCQ